MSVTSAGNAKEIPRFEFGRNWSRFVSGLDDERIVEAEASLQAMLGCQDLVGKSFLDAGSGSGLFSLAALRLGAGRVHSFDYDPASVETTREVKRRYAAEAGPWTIERGDLLDAAYLAGLRQWDVVYSWGVLHHTGDMWRALENILPLVAPGGMLFIAIYNYQPRLTDQNKRLKRTYVSSGQMVKALMLGAYILCEITRGALVDLVRLHQNPLRRYRDRRKSRGMSVVHDWIDWVGGYPFEAARPEEVFDFCRKWGFVLQRLKTDAGGHGCNEFVFARP